MPTFYILANTSGITHPVANNSSPIVGFYSTLRVKARNLNDAIATALQRIESDGHASDIIESSKVTGVDPKTIVEEIYKVSWFRSLLPYKATGLIFYDDSED